MLCYLYVTLCVHSAELVNVQTHGVSGYTAASSCSSQTSSGQTIVSWLVLVALQRNLVSVCSDIAKGMTAYFLPRFASRKSTCFRTVAWSAITPCILFI